MKNKAKEVFYDKKFLDVFKPSDKQELMELANKGDIHAIYCLIMGMDWNVRSYEETFVDEDTKEEITIPRSEYIDGFIFEKEEGEKERLAQKLYDMKEKMSDEELSRIGRLSINETSFFVERIKRGEEDAALLIDNPVVLQDLCEQGNKYAAFGLAEKYSRGDEEHGIFINPQKAKLYYAMTDETNEVQDPEDEIPYLADYIIKGTVQGLEVVKKLVEKLTNRYGTPNNELGLYVPMNILMNTLVGSPHYRGNLLSMNTENPECIILHAELYKTSALLYALRQAFPNLSVEMEETAW